MNGAKPYIQQSKQQEQPVDYREEFIDFLLRLKFELRNDMKMIGGSYTVEKKIMDMVEKVKKYQC